MQQERRVHDVMSRGSYESVEAVVDAALAAVEQFVARSYSGPAGIAPRPFVTGYFWICIRCHVNNRRVGQSAPNSALRATLVTDWTPSLRHWDGPHRHPDIG